MEGNILEYCQGAGSAVLQSQPAERPAHIPRYAFYVSINEGCMLVIAGEAGTDLHIPLSDIWACQIF